jgi:hypothetical protein
MFRRVKHNIKIGATIAHDFPYTTEFYYVTFKRNRVLLGRALLATRLWALSACTIIFLKILRMSFHLRKWSP